MSKKTIVDFLKFALFASIGIAIFWWFYRTQDTAFQEQLRLEGKPNRSLASKLIEDFRSVNLFYIGLTLVAFSISNISRSVRWRMLLRPLGHEPKLMNLFAAVNISYLTNLWMSRAGEVVRAGTISRYEGISLSRVMGTIIIDRLLDLLTLGIIVAASFFLIGDTVYSYLSLHAKIPANPLESPLFVALLFGGVVGMWLFWRFRHLLWQTKFGQKIRGVLHKMWEGSKTIRQIESPFWFTFHSINIWVMFYLMTYFCFFAFAPTADLSPLAALTVFVFGTFGIVIPSPGGMGTYHVLATAALAIYGINQNDAFAFANIMFFTIQIFYNIVMGVTSTVLLPILNPKRKDALITDDDDE
ncbi:MAG: hypothetical protein RL757_2873 [Bacteroidota bacterium]